MSVLSFFSFCVQKSGDVFFFLVGWYCAAGIYFPGLLRFQKLWVRKKVVFKNFRSYTFSFVSQIYSKGMCCHQISNGIVCILIIVHCHVVSVPRIVTHFVNFDARLIPILGNILPENNYVFELENYLDFQML